MALLQVETLDLDNGSTMASFPCQLRQREGASWGHPSLLVDGLGYP